MKPEILKESSCEHCGGLEPYTLTFNDDECTWCFDCATMVDDDFELGAEESKMLKEKEREKKKEYFELRLKEIKGE